MSDEAPLLQNSNFTTTEKTQADIGGLDPSNNEKAFSVHELNVFIRQLLENQLGTVWVRGELSNFKPHTSGHFYFSLKDSQAQISGVMFRGFNSKLKFKPHDGMEVLVRGRLTVYEPRGSYQINCDMMEPVGAGALQKAFEQLKEKLKNEGLFSAERKRPLPHYPQHIAVVTSSTGAAIKDILNILKRRAPGIQVTVVPTIVQGEGAAEQICQALVKAQKLSNVDVIICGRGGGSIEDLWAFNNEQLAREIARSTVPVISAVGHEIDFTIADFVADLRAPTPSAAAELVAKSAQELSQKVSQVFRLLKISVEKYLRMQKQKTILLHKSLLDPRKKLENYVQKNDELSERLSLAIHNLLSKRRLGVEVLTQRLPRPLDLIQNKKIKLLNYNDKIKNLISLKIERSFQKLRSNMQVMGSLSPLNVVDRGYSIVSKNLVVVKSVDQIEINDLVNVRLAKGNFEAKVTQKIN